jgi:UDP-GlcNAc3NAcA epimerase
MSVTTVTIVGARPQFVKVAAVSRAMKKWNRANPGQAIRDHIVHTGQHFDDNMSGVFFRQLDIPEPAYNLGIAGTSHGAMTGRMIESIETVLQEVRPDWVLVYGDTNSTLAAALAAIKLQIPVAHVEAGLRSFNMRMPEEVNRIVADSVSTLLFCPTETAVENLRREGYGCGVHNVGDVMFDASLHMRAIAERQSDILDRLKLAPQEFVLATCHRAENTDDPERLRAIVDALREVSNEMPVVLPLHPRTRKLAMEYGLRERLDCLLVTEPLSYLDITRLEVAAAAIATDSGGMQKEAYFYQVPCITLRDETEWVETISSGWNRLAPPTRSALTQAIRGALVSRPLVYPQPYGNGSAAESVVEILCNTPRAIPNRRDQSVGSL